jgi:hypothetical protein
MIDILKRSDELSRRLFLERAAATCLGVTLGPKLLLGADEKKPAFDSKGKGGKAKNVIYLMMAGAMSHLDTFDLKPGREVQGETKGIDTNVSGMKFGEWVPGLAKVASELAVVRSLHTETGDHEQGRYLFRTSYKEIASIRHPGMGAWAMRLLGQRTDRTLPDNVVIGPEGRHPGAGFLEPVYTPVPVGDPIKGLQNTAAPAYLTDQAFEKRLDLINRFDAGFRKKFPQKQVEAYTEFYRQASALMSSADLKAFDLSQEKQETRDAYGTGQFGQGCLLARRLVESDVRFVEVNLGGWDMHTEIFDKVGDVCGNLDKAMAALIVDLKTRGLLDHTLVVLGTEFGRTPRINQNAGRDHHPAAFSGVLAGGGIRGGQFYGTSDEDAFQVDSDGVTPADFNATIALAMGLPIDKEIISSVGRPFKVAHDGTPVLKLFS